MVQKLLELAEKYSRSVSSDRSFNCRERPNALTLNYGKNPTIRISSNRAKGCIMKVNNKIKVSILTAVGLLSCTTVQALTTAAGEPDSLQARMFADDYERALIDIDPSAAAGPVIGAALELERLKINGRVSESQTLPLSYTVRSDLDPRRQTTASLRLVHARSHVPGDIRENYSYVAGLAFRRPMNDQWTIVPAVSAGYVEDRGNTIDTTGSIYGVSVASVYKVRRQKFDIAVANQLSHYRTREFRITGVSPENPQINNTVMRNGVVVAMPTVLAGRKLSTELSLTRTDILTDHHAPFFTVDYFNEVSLTLGNNKRLANGRSFVRGGISYLDGQGDVRGLRVKLGYWF